MDLKLASLLYKDMEILDTIYDVCKDEFSTTDFRCYDCILCSFYCAASSED